MVYSASCGPEIRERAKRAAKEAHMASKSARHRAKLKAKHMKKRARDCGFSKVRKKGGRVKKSGKRPRSGALLG